MISNEIMMIIVMIILMIVIISIRYIINRNIERGLINLVLSKIDFSPDNYKINRKDNKIFIKCHYLFDSKYIYNDASLERTNHFIFNGGLKVVDIIIDLKEKKYKIIIIAFHIINTSYELFGELKEKLNISSYYFINNIIDLNFNIDNNDISLCNIDVPDTYIYIHNETSNYDKYICNRYSILLTDDKESIYINSISNTFPNNTIQPLLSNEIRIKELECRFI
jgi:hypothetical protein